MSPIVLYSPYKCIIKNDKQSVYIDQNSHLVIDNPVSVCVYPTGKTKKYAFSIDLDHLDSEFYRVVKKDNKTLVFLLDGLLSENIEIFEFEYENIKSSIEIAKTKIVFVGEKSKKVINLPNQIKSFQCGQFYHIDYILFENHDGDLSIILYNIKNNKAKILNGDEIQILDNGIMVKRFGKGLYSDITEEYIIDRDGLKTGSKTFSLSSQAQNQELCVYNFMTALKNGDTSFAYSFLTQSLKDKISPDTLKTFFGNLSYFYLIDPTTVFAISDGQNKIYNFTLKGKQISDISDNE